MTFSKAFSYSYNIASENNELAESLQTFSTASSFANDTWIMDRIKRKGEDTGKHSVYFAGIPQKHMDLTKKFVLSRLIARISLSTVKSNINGLVRFFYFLENECDLLGLEGVSKNTICAYEDYLANCKDVQKSTKENFWTAIKVFFSIMKTFEGVPNIRIGCENPFSRSASDRLIGSKYIPQDVIKQFDDMFFEKDLPLQLKCVYWICRLIPSRVGEVVSIPIECVRQYGDEYTLSLNMYKQNGGYIEPETRMIGFKYEDMGKYLLDLIYEQKKVSKSLQEYIEADDQDLLFTFTKGFYKTHGKLAGKYVSFKPGKTTVSTMTSSSLCRQLNTLAQRYQIKDNNGEVYQITSHQLRHNAITDRIYAGFSLLEIKDLTHHKTTAMIEGSYTHPDKEKTIHQARIIANEENAKHGFKGKIINENVNTYERIRKMPRAHSLGRLGICSDISACKNDMFECLGCDFFKPEIDELEYFEEQVTQWKEKTILFKNNRYMLENAQYNLELNQKIVDKVTRMRETGCDE